MKFKEGDRVKINPKTVNRRIDNTKNVYVSNSVLGDKTEYYIEEIEHTPVFSFGYRVHLKGFNRNRTFVRFWIYEKDLIHEVKYYEAIQKRYLI